MRLTIDHRTAYRFTRPQARVVQLLRMTPATSDDQLVAAWHLSVDRDAHMTAHRDGFGNCTTMLYVEGPIEALEIVVAGEVVTSAADGAVHGANEPLPARMFLRDTPATAADAALADFARTLDGNGDGDSDGDGDGDGAGGATARLRRLNEALHARFAVRRERPEPGLTAAAAFARETATPRDLAQMFVSAARTLGAPARYVSGYCDLAGDRNPTPHGWAEAWVEGIGWTGFDPTLGVSPDRHHVRVAVALDAAGAAPVAGSRLGEGEEVLEVAVTVRGDE